MSSGFSKIREKRAGQQPAQILDLSGFKPAIPDALKGRDDEAVADKVAHRHGLPAEPMGRVPLNRQSAARDRLFVTGPIDILNRFRTYCNQQNVQMAVGLEMLMDLAKIDE